MLSLSYNLGSFISWFGFLARIAFLDRLRPFGLTGSFLYVETPSPIWTLYFLAPPKVVWSLVSYFRVMGSGWAFSGFAYCSQGVFSLSGLHGPNRVSFSRT